MTIQRKSSILYDGTIKVNFNPDRHMYQVQYQSEHSGEWVGKHRPPSATGITGMADDGKSRALMIWATGLQCDATRDGIMQVGFDALDEVSLERILKKARWAHKDFTADAASVGTIVHDWAELHIQHGLGLGPEPAMPRNEEAVSGINAFLKWEEDHKPVYVAAEQLVYSIEHDYVGTYDILAYVDGDLAVVDLKTSKSVRQEYHLQLAGYMHAVNEERLMLGQDLAKQRIVLHLSKIGGHFEPHHIDREHKKFTTYEDDLAEFLRLRGSWEYFKKKVPGRA